MQAIEANAAAAKPLSDMLIELIPRNPLESAVRALDGEMLPLMVFALIFGVAVSRLRRGKDEDDVVLVRVFEQIFDACMRIVHFAMLLAPFAVFAIVFNTAFTFGTGIFASLLYYVVTVVAGLLIQQFVVYSALLWTVARRSPVEFFRKCREVYLYAFSTASSNATLPLSLDVAENKLHLPPQISRFVLTVGSTANQNGTALFEGVTVLFLAQVYGLDLTVGQQIRVMVMSILAGVGHGRRAGRLAADGDDRRAVGRHSRRRHGAHPRRRSVPRHVPDGGQRERRSRDCRARQRPRGAACTRSPPFGVLVVSGFSRTEVRLKGHVSVCPRRGDNVLALGRSMTSIRMPRKAWCPVSNSSCDERGR